MSTSVEATSEVLRHRAEAALAKGDLKKAERYLLKTLDQWSGDHEALALMAEVRLCQSQTVEAFSLYMRAVNAWPTVHAYKERFLELAGRGLSVAHSEELETAVVACLKTPDLGSAMENWASLLMANPEFHAAFGLANRRAFDKVSQPFFFNTCDLKPLVRPLLLEGMKSNVVCHPVFEDFVTQLRRHLLDAFTARGGRFGAEECITIASTLSHYALFTDFILEETDRETARIDQLQCWMETEPETAENAAALAIFACYRPLHTLANSKV